MNDSWIKYIQRINIFIVTLSDPSIEISQNVQADVISIKLWSFPLSLCQFEFYVFSFIASSFNVKLNTQRSLIVVKNQTEEGRRRDFFHISSIYSVSLLQDVFSACFSDAIESMKIYTHWIKSRSISACDWKLVRTIIFCWNLISIFSAYLRRVSRILVTLQHIHCNFVAQSNFVFICTFVSSTLAEECEQRVNYYYYSLSIFRLFMTLRWE